MKFIYTLIITSVLLFNGSTYSQIGVGFSYEIQNETPQWGLSTNLEYILPIASPMLSIAIKGRASYYKEETRSLNGTAGIFLRSTDVEAKTIGFGLGGIGLLNTNFPLQPYVGMDLGITFQDFFIIEGESSNNSNFSNRYSIKETNVGLNAVGGFRFTPIPYFKPFIEYRIGKAFNEQELPNPNNHLSVGAIVVFNK